MKGAILLGLLGVGAGAALAWTVFHEDTPKVQSSDGWDPGNINTWGLERHRNIIILNWDGTFYAMAGELTDTNEFLVWKDGTKQFRKAPDDDWEGARATPPQPFPWIDAVPDRVATADFNAWVKNRERGLPTQTVANAMRPNNAGILLNFQPL